MFEFGPTSKTKCPIKLYFEATFKSGGSIIEKLEIIAFRCRGTFEVKYSV